MANEGLKNLMFRQALQATSVVAKEALGTLRITDDGRKFRYAKNGAAALVGGNAVMAPAVVAHHINMAVVANVAAGKTSVTVTLGATAATENLYAGGYLQVTAGANGIGMQYKIASHPAADASATLTVQLDEPLVYALTNGTHTVRLVHNQFTGLVVATAVAQPAVGVTPCPVAANAYFWLQTGGVANVQQTTTTALGGLIRADTAGRGAIVAAYTAPIIGYMLGVAATAEEASAVMLVID